MIWTLASCAGVVGATLAAYWWAGRWLDRFFERHPAHDVELGAEPALRGPQLPGRYAAVPCLARSPVNGWHCGRARGHRGDHIQYVRTADNALLFERRWPPQTETEHQ